MPAPLTVDDLLTVSGAFNGDWFRRRFRRMDVGISGEGCRDSVGNVYWELLLCKARTKKRR